MKNFIIKDKNGCKHFIRMDAVAYIELDGKTYDRSLREHVYSVNIHLLCIEGSGECSSDHVVISLIGKQAEAIKHKLISTETDCDFSDFFVED